MTIPSIENMELPLLLEIERAGGAIYWKDLSSPVASHFPALTPNDLAKTTKKGQNFWVYRRLKPARTVLSKKEELSPETGTWRITDKGRDRLRQAGLPKEEAVKPTCKCGCGEVVPQGTMHVPGHDAIHRSKLIDKAGGVDSLQALLRLADTYMAGEVGESELAKGIRRLRAR